MNASATGAEAYADAEGVAEGDGVVPVSARSVALAGVLWAGTGCALLAVRRPRGLTAAGLAA